MPTQLPVTCYRLRARCKNFQLLPALLMLGMLSACNGGNSGVSVDGGQGDGALNVGVTTGQQTIVDLSGPTTPIIADDSLSALAAGTREQVYRGSVGDGTGTFLLDDSNRLIGLLIAADGSVRSVRADLATDNSATVQQFNHQSRKSLNGLEVYPFADGAQVDSLELEVIDGQRISSLSDALPLSLSAPVAGTLSISAASLQGEWTGSYLLCDAREQNCGQFILQFTVTGSELTGSSKMLAADGTDLLPSPVSGSFRQRGTGLDVSMRWNTYVYEGLVFVDATNSSRLNLAATTNSEIADERTLAISLVRLQ